MARFHGEVGYGVSYEDPPGSGIWVDAIEEFHYQGDVIRDIRRLTEGYMPNDVNADITVGNAVSVVADEYANQHYYSIKYVRLNGVAWNVTSVEVRAPRLILSLGSVYNGVTA